jgi:hypothetical protein
VKAEDKNMRASRDLDEVKRAYLQRVQPMTGGLRLHGRRNSRWAVGAAGVVSILAASERRSDRWWFGLSGKAFETRKALGIILLCQSKVGGVDDFGLPARRVLEILPSLSSDTRDEQKMDVVRHGDRFVLRVPGGDDIDLTPARGDLSWLKGEPGGADRAEPHDARDVNTSATDGPEPAERSFFAQFRAGHLEPLDPPPLSDGDLVLVKATRIGSVPGTAALRRIVANAGPTSLPPDFAERHDYYAHGAARR